jgi:hypothetical protein
LPLLEVLSQLCEEFGSTTCDQEDGGGLPQPGRAPATPLPSEEEQMVTGLMAGLARLIGLQQGDASATPAAAAQAALDGAEYLARSEISVGESRRLSQLLPDLAFFVVLQRSGEDEALRVAERAALLLGAHC